jgi:hypothetical protein
MKVIARRMDEEQLPSSRAAQTSSPLTAQNSPRE